MRLTKDVRKKLLELNEGLIVKTDYSSRNFPSPEFIRLKMENY